jgi:hypothetical protein
MSKNAPHVSAPADGVPAFPKLLDAASEEARGRQIAERLGIPFVDLWTFRIDPALFRSSSSSRSGRRTAPSTW